MAWSWSDLEVRFVRGGGGIWDPGFNRLDRRWFKQNLIDYDFWYVFHGKGVLRDAKGGETSLHPGVCLWMRPGSDFEALRAPGHELGTRWFHFDLLDRAGRAVPPSRIADIPLTCRVEDLPYFDNVTRRMIDLLQMAPLLTDPEARGDSRQTIAALLRGLLIEFVFSWRVQTSDVGGSGTQDQLRLVSNAIASMRSNPGQADISRAVRASGYCEDHFRRVFKRVTGKTPHRALIAARIERARDLLESSTLSVGAIADQLGYPNVQHFSMQFKQQTGASPTEYRARWQSNMNRQSLTRAARG